MFGYVKPYVPDLRIREHDMYRALYCGLCKSMGAHTGCISRFTLSYDFVFLAAVRTSLSGIVPKAELFRCMAHPMKKRPMICDNDALSYSAACAAVLMRAKVLDDVNDKTGFSKIGSKFLLPAAGRMEKKATSSFDIPRDEIYAKLSELSHLEKEKCPSLDDTATVFGELLGSVFAHGLSGNNEKLAYEIGVACGKFIYVIDAADDFEKDKKEGNYNPLILSPVSREGLAFALRLELSRINSAVCLIDSSASIEISEIIKNIIYEGMPKAFDTVLKKYPSVPVKG